MFLLLPLSKWKNPPIYIKKITKWSSKNFSQQSWNDELRKQDWNSLEDAIDVDVMVRIYTDKQFFVSYSV